MGLKHKVTDGRQKPDIQGLVDNGEELGLYSQCNQKPAKGSEPRIYVFTRWF